MRLDYIFARSNTLRSVSSQVVFTAPYEKVWMSDHHGMLTVLSEAEANPKTQIIQLTSEQFNRPTSPEVSVSGARGVSFTNETGFAVKISLTGPAAILTSTSVVLKPNERAAFSFTQKGRFYYEVKKHNLSALFKPRSSVNVFKSGF
jgi:hypothetical protein